MVTAETIRQALTCGQPGCSCGRPGGLVHCPAHEDKTPSLSVSKSNGKILVKDHAGCSQGEVIKALKAKGQWPATGNGTPGQARIVATYDYHDAAGKILFQVVRNEPKKFWQRRPDGNGGWINEVKSLPGLVPYHLPEILQADTVYICEGEKDADRLRSLGVTATCNPQGAGKWRDEYNPHFKGKADVILPDNDPPGKAHAQDVARNLHGVARSLKIVELPDLPEKGDVFDWLAGAGTLEHLEKLVKAAPEWRPQPLMQEAPVTGFNLTDLGNAQRLVAQHGQDLRYCYTWGKWLVWDGVRWAKDESGEVDRRAKETVRSIYVEAGAIEEKGLREATADHAKRSESDSKRQSMINSARSEPGIPILPEHLDRDPWLLNVLNGTLDLRTGKLQEHRRGDLISKLAPVEYDPEAECPTWWKFLEHIMGRNFDLIFFLQKAVGYALTGVTLEQVLFFLYGLGANGKSTFIEVIQALLGDYATQTTSETFMMKRHGSPISNDVADLRGARFVAAVEIESGRRMAEVLIKQMTGGDKLKARFLYSEHFEFKPEFKIFLAANHKPIIRGTDHAIWRRIRLTPFTVQIPETEQDKELPEKLKAELPGILNWAIEGCINWQDHGLAPPQAVQEATQTYKDEMDILGNFVGECCIIASGASATAKELYSAYNQWAEDNGEKRPLPQRAFGMSLTERGFQRDRGTGGVFIWRGIGLKAE